MSYFWGPAWTVAHLPRRATVHGWGLVDRLLLLNLSECGQRGHAHADRLVGPRVSVLLGAAGLDGVAAGNGRRSGGAPSNKHRVGPGRLFEALGRRIPLACGRRLGRLRRKTRAAGASGCSCPREEAENALLLARRGRLSSLGRRRRPRRGAGRCSQLFPHVGVSRS